MKHPSLLASALGCLVVMAACSADPVTQVFVRVDVEPDIESRIVTLEVSVFGGPASGALEESDLIEVDAANYAWPATLGVVPEGGDATRIFEVHALALDADDNVIAEARGTTTFIDGETRVLDLLLYDDCVGVSCLETETCAEGECFDAFVDAVGLPSYTCPLICGALCVDDPQYDDDHCGSCDNACGDAEFCVEGVCEEAFCELVCGDVCVEDPTTDAAHCGMCDNPCDATESCIAGRCEPDGDAFAPTSDTILEPGDHMYSRVHIPAGVTVRTTGRAEVRILSEGDVLIEGRFDLSGGNGGAGADVAGGPTGAGGGGATGRPSPGETSDGCGQGGDGGSGGAGAIGQNAPLSLICDPTPAMSGGGAGAVLGSGGNGGGGYAGGGGGGGAYSQGAGGAGASFGSAVGGGGGSAGRNGRGEDPIAGGGLGGMAPGPYGGQAGTSMEASGCTFGPAPEWEAAGGGGGSIGADAADDPGIFSTFRAGSGGGGGGGAGTNGSSTPGGGGGGGGGGALRIESATSIRVTVSGSILANGGNGGGVSLREPSGGGGGGSGGAVVLQAPAVDVAGRVSARGGLPGMNMCGANGGAGGLGRIRISVGGTCSLTGTFEPPLRDGCNASSAPGAVFVADL